MVRMVGTHARAFFVGIGMGTMLMMFSACALPFNTSTEDGPEPTATTPLAEEVDSAIGLEPTTDDRPIAFEFAVVADSHSDHDAYPALLAQIVASEAAFILHLGDLTRVGGREELALARAELAATGLPYYAIPGDHDVVRGGGVSYFEEEIGAAYQRFEFQDVQFLLLNNADLELGIEADQFRWLESNIDSTADLTFVALHNPPEHPWLAMHTMVENAVSKAAAETLFGALQSLDNVQVLAGELHIFSTYDWQNTLPLTVAGAAGADRNPGGPMYLRVIVRGDYDQSVETEAVYGSP